MTLMLLNQAENKWNFKMQILEIEIDKLKRELGICGEDGKSINVSADLRTNDIDKTDSLTFSNPSL